MNITDYTDYKQFLKDKITSFPKRGHGLSRKLALHLDVNSVVVSQVISGSKHFTVEQALKVGEFFFLTDMEKEFFLLLIQKERAGTADLKKFFQKKIEKLQSDAKTLQGRHASDRELDETQKAQFYSNWFYSGIRIITSIPGKQTPHKIAEHFHMTENQVRDVLDFLLRVGLVVESNGVFTVGPRFTMITRESPFVNNHRRNWRLKALEHLNSPALDTVHISAPYSISASDYEWVHKKIMTLIEESSKKISQGNPEHLACLNIDWFRF